MPIVPKDKLKVLASTKDINDVMTNLHSEGNQEVQQFFKKKEETIDSIFKEANPGTKIQVF